MIQNFVAKLSPKEKKIFYIAVICVSMAMMDRLFLGPAMSRLKSLDEDIEQQKNVIKSDLRFLAYKDKILKENEAFSEYYVEKPQSEEEFIAAFLKKVEMFASEAKVNLIKLTPASPKQYKGYIEYYANLECEGRLEDIAKFSYTVDTSDELLKIITLSINPKKAGSEDIVAIMTVTKTIIDASSMQEARELAGVKEESKASKEKPGTGEEHEITTSVWEKFMEKTTK